ncbi:PAS and ANTAR domain-containing protein [Promicromonospora sp. NPDC090134]|uniref:PAS and ANTAR domain-containing protein n=1 Tax=Promicromonospora sp. NPDC090134 TaxID=3364408 RepID=UPI0038140138
MPTPREPARRDKADGLRAGTDDGTDDGTREDRVEEVLVRGDRAPVGRYRLDLTTGRWAWSDQVYAMHGFEPGQVVPTTPLMLAHQHPEDRGRVDGVLRRAAQTGQPFSSVHRIIDAAGKTRTVAITGQGRRDPGTGRVAELFGYFIDVTKSQQEAAARDATAAIHAAAQRQAGIEQAKGVLMVVYGIGEETASERLYEAADQANIPVRDIADSLLHLFAGPDITEFPTPEAIDKFLTDPVAPDSL